jgi:hypothetical protein
MEVYIMVDKKEEKNEDTYNEESIGNPEPKKNQRIATEEVRKKFPKIGEMDF